MQANTNNVNKTRALLQITGDKDEPNIVYVEIVMDITIQNSERRDTFINVTNSTFKRYTTSRLLQKLHKRRRSNIICFQW